MWEITTFFYDTCVPRDGDDKQESPSPVEKGERTRLRVGGSHASLPCKDGVTRTEGSLICKPLHGLHVAAFS